MHPLKGCMAERQIPVSLLLKRGGKRSESSTAVSAKFRAHLPSPLLLPNLLLLSFSPLFLFLASSSSLRAMGPPKLKKSKPTPAGPSPKLAQISTLESLLTSTSSSSLNPLADLLHLVTSSPEPQVVHKGVYSLGRVFASLVESGKLDGTVVSEKEGGEKERKVREWVRARLAEFVSFLGGLMKDVEKDLRVSQTFLLVLVSWVRNEEQKRARTSSKSWSLSLTSPLGRCFCSYMYLLAHQRTDSTPLHLVPPSPPDSPFFSRSSLSSLTPPPLLPSLRPPPDPLPTPPLTSVPSSDSSSSLLLPPEEARPTSPSPRRISTTKTRRNL